MARILVVKPNFPYPPSQGTRRVSLALVRDLASAHDVAYLCQRESRAEEALIPKIAFFGVGVVAPLMPNKRSALHRGLYKAQNLIKSRILRRPAICFYWTNRVLRDSLTRLTRDFGPDLVIIENWETFDLRRSTGRIPTVLLAHDAAFQIRERSAQAVPEGAERARRLRRFRREKELELRAWTMFDAILALTESDKRTIEGALALQVGAGTAAVDRAAVRAARALPSVHHLPMPIAEEFFSFSRPARPEGRIGFLGTFRSDFNIDALAHLLRDLWPAIRARVPNARLIVAGDGHPGPLRAEVQAIGGEWSGYVDDLGTFFGSIDVLLVPLRFGGGLRIRILEALAAATPVVASAIAAAGLPIGDGEHYLSATTADEVSEAVARLVANPAEAAALGERGRAWCAANHSVEALRPRRLEVVEAVLRSVGSRRG